MTTCTYCWSAYRSVSCHLWNGVDATNLCWADVRPDGGQVCNEVVRGAGKALGLCDLHREEVVGAR